MLMGGNTIETSLLQCLNQPDLSWENHGEGTNPLLSYADGGGGNLQRRSGKRKLRAFGISSPLILLSCSQNSMTATFLPWSAVLLFSSVGSKSLSYWHGPVHRPVWNTELSWISRLCVYWQVVQPHRNDSVGPNSWCWGPDGHIICIWGREWLFWTSCKLWFRCCLGVYLPFNFIRKTPILYTLRLLYHVNHSTVNGDDLKGKYRLAVN